MPVIPMSKFPGLLQSKAMAPRHFSISRREKLECGFHIFPIFCPVGEAGGGFFSVMTDDGEDWIQHGTERAGPVQFGHKR